MSKVVVRANEIYLNAKRYPIIGQVRPILASTFPSKVVTGDYSKESEQILSSWTVSDQRGGILIEEMDESTDNNRCWMSTLNTRFRANFCLPPLATSVTVPSDPALPSITNADMELTTGWLGSKGERSDAQAHAGTYSWLMSTQGEDYQDLTWSNALRGRKITFTCWVYAANGSTARININDGVGTTESSYHAGDSAWAQLTVTRILSPTATRLRIILDRSAAYICYFDDAAITGATGASTLVDMENFNSNLYAAFGTVLTKLNTTSGTVFDNVYEFSAAITALKRSVNGMLYIYLGDSDEYWYMTTAEAFTETNVDDASLAVHWDAKLWKMAADGEIWHAATPNSATPSWTTNGTIDLDASAAKNLLVYRDATGEPIIYVATTSGLWAHDYTNGKFLATELTLPEHPNCGRGVCRWRDALYISAGLDIHKYIAGSTATISQVGLDRDDGLPSEYRGEVTKLIQGYNDLFALIDASQVAGTGYSTVMARDDLGWWCMWADGTADQAMSSGIVSSVKDYRFWFNAASLVYYIALERNIRNPNKISSYTYGAAGLHITPWFDANWASGEKLAVRFKVYCDNMTASETVIVKYRTDRANTDRDTGWTTLGTIAASGDGETEYSFGSGAGIAFNAIQFRFDLARGGTTTLSPIIRWYSLAYEKKGEIVWGYRADVDCTRAHLGRTPQQMIDDLTTATESATLVEFCYLNDTGEIQRVEVRSLSGNVITGDNEAGQYSIFVVAP